MTGITGTVLKASRAPDCPGRPRRITIDSLLSRCTDAQGHNSITGEKSFDRYHLPWSVAKG